MVGCSFADERFRLCSAVVMLAKVRHETRIGPANLLAGRTAELALRRHGWRMDAVDGASVSWGMNLSWTKIRGTVEGTRR